MSNFDDYALGRSHEEYARLARQAAYLAPTTRRMLTDAGIAPGMHVLDLGCGAGDVCMMLSEFVGPQGSVVGLDNDPDVIAHAKTRTTAAGFANIEFAAGSFDEFTPLRKVDAIVGRLVLMYQPDPVAALRALVPHLRPGGIVAFQEPWFQPPGGPDSHVKHATACIIETLRRSGARLDVGPRLHRIFTAAGLLVPEMRWETVMDGSDDSPLYQAIADTLGSILPKAIDLGVAREGEFDLDTLAGHIQAEMQAVGYAMLAAPLVAAWGRSPQL